MVIDETKSVNETFEDVMFWATIWVQGWDTQSLNWILHFIPPTNIYRVTRSPLPVMALTGTRVL